MAERETAESPGQCAQCGVTLSSQNGALGTARDTLCRRCAWQKAADPDYRKNSEAKRITIAEPMTFHLDGDTDSPTQLLLLLHGLGTNGENMRPVARSLAQRLPRTLCVSPDAPWLMLDAMPQDDVMISRIMQPDRDWESSRSWLPALHPTARNASALTAQAGASSSASGKSDNLTSFQHSFDPLLSALERLVNSLQAEHGLPTGALAVYGFSVGATVAAYFGVRREPACAGVVCHSGAVPGLTSVASRPPMLLIAGSRELGFFKPLRKSYPATAKVLRAASVPVEQYVGDGLGHDINNEVVERVASFFRRVLDVPYEG